MNYYRATIQYDGTGYCGFQWQTELPTIQNDINTALKKLLPDQQVSTVGASRTDTGVHALEQVVKITCEEDFECVSFLKQLNQTLPSQIRALSLEACPGSFNPIVGTSSKEYRYLFTNALRSNGLEQRLVANHPYELDLELMQKCCEMILGEQDFHYFCSTGSNVKTTVRTIYACGMTLVDPHQVLPQNGLFSVNEELRECFQFRIVGNGFLKQMVRHLVSAIWLVGRRKISVEDFDLFLHGPKKTVRRWKVADARGLYLYKVNP